MGRCDPRCMIHCQRPHADWRRPFDGGKRCGRSLKKVKVGCTRTYLVVLNFVFLIGGSTVLGLGFWMSVDVQPLFYTKLIHRFPSSGPMILFDRLPSVFVILGGSVAILSFLGCCGACANSACFLSLYVLLICLVLITEVIVAVLVTCHRDKILRRFEVALQHQIRVEYSKATKQINATMDEYPTAIIDAMQIKLNCCGATGPEDFRLSAWFNRTRHVDEVFVPSSCCISLSDDPQEPKFKDENQCQIEAIIYDTDRKAQHPHLKTQGCHRSVVLWVRTNTLVIVTVICTSLVLQVFALSAACLLMARVRRKHVECSSEIPEEDFSELG